MKKILIGLSALVALAQPAYAARFYSVDEFNNLITFDSAAPGTTLTSVAISGIGGATILTMDIRAKDGQLYALSDDNKLYRVNKGTGVSTFVQALALTGSNFAFDFNPVNTNLRIVSNDNSNYVRNFTSGLLVPGANVAYGAGPLFGVDPDITGAAYLNTDNNPGTGTTLFVLDSRNDVLATQNAMTGVLTRVGATGLNIGARTSFEIVTRGANNQAFAQDANRLYRVNLATGALSLVGNTDRSLFALTADVPEPATWAMLMTGFGFVGAMTRRRRNRMVSVTA